GDASRMSAALAHVERFVRLDLPPLDRGSVRALLTGALGPRVAEALGAELHRVSGGNPALLQRAFEALVAEGALARRSGEWILVDPTVRITMPGDALAAAKARVAPLPPAARRTLETAAQL